MRSLFLALGNDRIASSRIRAWRFADELRQMGEDVTCVVGPSRQGVREILRGPRWDLILVQKWAMPWWAARLIRLRARKVVYECDDAIYLPVPRPSKYADRNRKRALRNMKGYDAFQASTPQIEADLRRLGGSKPTFVFPGPVPDTIAAETERSGLLWLGSPATQSYVLDIEDQLRDIAGDIAFLAVGVSDDFLSHGLNGVPWSPETQEHWLQTARIGLFVQPRGEWEDRKSGYKILEYISHGVLPIANRVEAAEVILGPDYPFFVVDEEWADVIRRAHGLSPSEHREIVRALSDRIERWSYRSIASSWREFVEGTRAPRREGHRAGARA